MKLQAKTLTSKIALNEIKAALPAAKYFAKKHVPGCGYVLYVKNEQRETIAHVEKTFDGLTLTVKAA